VCGGVNVGLLGLFTDVLIEEGVMPDGVITSMFARQGLAHAALRNIDVVEATEDRTAGMVRGCDGILVLPGGVGTANEVFSCLARAALGELAVHVSMLSTDGFYDPLTTWLDLAHMSGLVDGETWKSVSSWRHGSDAALAAAGMRVSDLA
jgi:predicted Rossmann-fold nucleotide-binding protein